MVSDFTFLGGSAGRWEVLSLTAVRGGALAPVPRLDVVPGLVPDGAPGSAWALRGVVSNIRYATAAEMDGLRARQEGLARPGSSRAALIPIRKTAAWWELPQDSRRAIFEETSRHTAIGMEYLPGIARRLHHGRDLGEPFDFLTWFEYPPAEAERFETLVARLRATPEWAYVEREVDVRLQLSPSS